MMMMLEESMVPFESAAQDTFKSSKVMRNDDNYDDDDDDDDEDNDDDEIRWSASFKAATPT